MKKVLVFGGTGFLGYYLIKELLNRSYNVSIADISINEKEFDKVEYYKCDILKRNQIDEILKKTAFDIVYNLAGFASLDHSANNPLETISLNVIGNMNVVESCIENNIKKYVFASSAYAMSNKGSFYGISKLASEKIIEEYHKKNQLTFTILRYGSVYSEREYDNNYIYNTVKKAIKEKIIHHNGDGNELREYIHASDAAKLSVDIIETKSYDNLHVVLTGTERMKRSDLFNMINEIMGGGIEIEYIDNNENHYQYTPYSFEPSLSKKLAPNPHIDMGQGLLECVKSVYNED